MRKEKSRLQRIPNDISKVAPSLEPVFFDRVIRARGMHEDNHIQLLRFGPEGIEFRIGEGLPFHVTAYCRADEPQILDGVLKLLRSQIRKLQRWKECRSRWSPYH